MERVATLWIGERFSFLEHLCLKSFADVDQTPIVYHYGDLRDIPDYIEARDAREIFDTPEIIRDPVTRSAAVHAAESDLNTARSLLEAAVALQPDPLTRENLAGPIAFLLGREVVIPEFHHECPLVRTAFRIHAHEVNCPLRKLVKRAF